jgi:glycosyltransferase involved in cell wall biosynthesis
VGRVSRAKGHDVAAKALTTLLSRGVDAELSIAGDASPDIRREMESLAPVGLKFLGFVEDTDELYRAHDVLLMSSQKEAFGRVTVEAMARGCVVVGTNSGGTPELITHGETGLLFDPSDASALADQVQSLCKDPSLVRRLRDEAHQRAFARFTRERYARDVAELYREAVSGA